MNGRRLFREYAQSKGKEAKEFVEIEYNWYDSDTLLTRDSNGKLEKTSIRYKEMVNWIISNYTISDLKSETLSPQTN